MGISSKKIISEFQRIKELGYIKNTHSDHNDGSVGNTFETLLGVEENNLKDPDFEGFEVKSHRKRSKSWISLFTSKPDSPSNGDNYMRENWGIFDEEYPSLKVFRTSIYAHRWTTVYGTYKYKVEIDNNEKKMFLLRADLNNEIIDKSVSWNFSTIANGVKKLANTFFVNAEVEERNDGIYYHFTDGIALTDYKGDEKFFDLLIDGTIRYDNRLGIYRTGDKKGNLHNHGGGFRINPKNISMLFENIIEVH